jgi:hypothetical protein
MSAYNPLSTLDELSSFSENFSVLIPQVSNMIMKVVDGTSIIVSELLLQTFQSEFFFLVAYYVQV